MAVVRLIIAANPLLRLPNHVHCLLTQLQVVSRSQAARRHCAPAPSKSGTAKLTSALQDQDQSSRNQGHGQ